MSRIVLALAGLVALSGPAFAQTAPVAKPRLAVVIVVDGLTSDLFLRYRNAFTAGLARAAQGTVFTNASAVADPSVPTAGVAIALGTPAGLGANRSWSWNGTQFAAGNPAAQSRVVPVANQAVAQLIARAEPALVPPPVCAGTTATNKFARAANDSAGFAASPAMDGAVLALGAGIAQEFGAGRDANGDVLTLGLPATARSAPGSENSCLQLLALDRDLGDFFAQLDRSGGDYIVALRGASAAGTVPMMIWRRGMAANSVAAPVSTADLMPTVSSLLGSTVPTAMGRCLPQVTGACLQR